MSTAEGAERMQQPLAITIVSDIICPWCYIGTRRLSQALASLRDVVSPVITYHAFLLDPSIPPEGADLRDRLRRKYRVDPEAMFRRIEAAAHETGIALDFSRILRTPNTIPGHTLLRHARARSTQAALADVLFTAYFVNGEDVGDAQVLAKLAVDFGFSREEALRLVADEREHAATRDEAEAAARQGIRGVPYFTFGEQVAFSGAQPLDVFTRAIAQGVTGQVP